VLFLAFLAAFSQICMWYSRGGGTLIFQEETDQSDPFGVLTWVLRLSLYVIHTVPYPIVRVIVSWLANEKRPESLS